MLASHRAGSPVLLPNASARLFTWLGFEALATTSSGFAATRGRLDGSMDRGQTLLHATGLVQATELPVSADLENGFGDQPGAVGETVRLALACGLAGCSIEDSTGRPDAPLFSPEAAAERVAAAAEVAHGGSVHLVLTGRAAVTAAATELLDEGTFGFWEQSARGLAAARAAFTR